MPGGQTDALHAVRGSGRRLHGCARKCNSIGRVSIGQELAWGCCCGGRWAIISNDTAVASVWPSEAQASAWYTPQPTPKVCVCSEFGVDVGRVIYASLGGRSIGSNIGSSVGSSSDTRWRRGYLSRRISDAVMGVCALWLSSVAFPPARDSWLL